MVTRMVYMFDEDTQSTVYRAVEYFTIDDINSEEGKKWFLSKLEQLGISPDMNQLVSDYAELAMLKFG